MVYMASSPWGVAASLGAPAGRRTNPPRHRKKLPFVHLAQVHKACHAAQASLQDGLSAWLDGKLPCRPLCGPEDGAAQAAAGERAARLVVAFLASVCLHLGGSSAAQAVNVPSAAEDTLLQVVRLLDNKIDTAAQMAAEALGSVTAGLGGKEQDADSAAAPGVEQWRALVEDVWEVVDSNFMDARGGGFTHERWLQLRDEALAQPLNSRAAAYGAIRDMVRRGLRDPYSRFISPDEFATMLKYDVSGVGLNLGTAEEFVNKTGIPLPGYTPPAATATPSSPSSSQTGSAASIASTGPGSDGSGPSSSPSSSGNGGSSSGSSASIAAAASVAAADAGSSSGGSSGSDGGGIYILGLIKGSAADAAGLQQGDQLLEVAGQGLVGQSPFEVASLLSGGQEGDEPEDLLGLARRTVELRVKKYDGGQEVVVPLERPVRVLPSPVTTRLDRPGSSGGGARLPAFLFGGSVAEGGSSAAGSSSGEGSEGESSGSSSEAPVGYIKLSSFNARAQRDVAAAVRQLEAAGAERVVLDLRDNRGGLVSEGIEVARLFLQDDALVVRTVGKARASTAPISAPGPALTSAPLLVLVNEHTASASEILAGALQDNCRAVLVGRQTYGKGLIQSVYELGDGSGLVLTVGKYMTPRGTDIDREGIHPQFRALPSAAAAEAALQACRLTPPNQPLAP